MSSNLNIKFIKRINSTKSIDSSELSSLSETNDILDISTENSKVNQSEQKDKILTNEFHTTKKVIIEKRPRFFSENITNFELSKLLRKPRAKEISKNLKKFTEDEMVDLNKRKFSFI